MRNHTCPPCAWCPICQTEVTDLGKHLAEVHPVRCHAQ